jgi:hypothetical protein
MTNECPFELAGGVVVDRTEDGGLTWVQQELDPPVGRPPFASAYLLCRTHSPVLHSPEHGSLVVECRRESGAFESLLYTTEDGGRSWQIHAYPGGALRMLDEDVGWALSRAIHRTDNGGQTWRLVKTVTWEGQFSFVSADLGWAVARSQGALALVRTTNGAQSFSLLEPVVGE